MDVATLSAQLGQLLLETTRLPDEPIALSDVTHDSRSVGPGSLFCAVPGARFDGHDFASASVERGAAALMVERWVDVACPQLRVNNVRAAMPLAAAAVHRHPSKSLDVFGITGTNGKTTTVHLLASILRSDGRSAQVVGTLKGAHTTPEGPDFQRLLSDAVDRNVSVVCAEVSSHALDQYRVDGTNFAVAAFTNLTADHLDYHHDMASYFAAKSRLFDGRADHELINVDDPWGQRLAEQRKSASRVTLQDVTVNNVGLSGTDFTWRGRNARVPLAGSMNVANAVMAAESARLLGVRDEAVVAGLAEAQPVPGRMEQVRVPDMNTALAPTVIVDYSHTPDSLERALATLRSVHPNGRLRVVFGCGGDRDRMKRPLMGEAASRGADQVFVTSDNPRSEPPLAIIDEILTGIADRERIVVESDRRAAIAMAIAVSMPNDVILVAGKGHERTQTIGSDVLDFDDVEVSAELLSEAAS